MTDCTTCRHEALDTNSYPCSVCERLPSPAGFSPSTKWEPKALPGHSAAVRTLERLGYTYHGGEEWRPPIGQAAQGAGEVVALPLFDELDDEAIDEACAAGAIYRVDFMRAWNALRDWRPYCPTPAQPAPVVPDGWKLVPVEPTEEMLAAAHEGDREYTLRNFGDVMTVMQGPYDHWCEMVNATPTPPAQAAQQGEQT